VVIDFKLEDRVTVIHGRNGSGKTLSLELLYLVVSGHWEDLNLCPWVRIQLLMADGQRLTLSRFRAGTSGAEELAVDIRHPNSVPAHAHLRRVSDRWVRRQNIDVLVQRIRERSPLLSQGDAPPARHPDLDWWDYLQGSLRIPPPLQHARLGWPAVKLVGVRRLEGEPIVPTSDDDDPPRHVMERVQEEVQDAFTSATLGYRQVSTDLDGSVIARLLAVRGPGPGPSELRARSAALASLEARLVQLGLLPSSTPVLPEEVPEDQLSALALLLDDREAKLAAFRSIADKSELLVRSLNEKLHPKIFSVHVDRGYELRTAAGAPLPLHRLSSGEQHQLVLLHELLFDLEPGTLVLIDEPELSLHISWQETLLPELLEVARTAQLDVVLATHSPYIIGERDDLMVQIGPPAAPRP